MLKKTVKEPKYEVKERALYPFDSRYQVYRDNKWIATCKDVDTCFMLIRGLGK